MTINQTTKTPIYSVHEIDFKKELDRLPRVVRQRGNPGRKNKPILIDTVCAFDIETSELKDIEQGFMYIWQFQFSHYTIIGRTWDEFLDMLQTIRDCIKPTERLVCYVHNLSFEFSYLKGVYRFRKDEVTCMDRRQILRCEMYGAIEFRCAYLHSNMSLAQFVKKMQCTTQKLVGDLDYSVLRFPWTELTDKEMGYCINDVVSLQEAIQREMAIDGDTLDTIPATSTGYVRRKCKSAMRSKKAFHSYITDLLPDYETFVALREAFRGGNTHANRYRVGMILENVHSVDRSSSYPDVLVNHEFPVSAFCHWGECTLERFLINKDTHKRACLVRIAFNDLELRNYYEPCPYLSKDKCRFIDGAIFDNGRILKALSLETTITDIDFDIIIKQYSFSGVKIIDSWFARYGKLPAEFTGVINDMYRIKTELKGDAEQAVLYDKTKQMVNALYGMTAQNPIKLMFEFVDNEFVPKEFDPCAELNKRNKQAFLSYAWGVWCTAWARYELQIMIDIAGDGVKTESCFVYADTDSVKYTGNIDKALEQYNRVQERKSLANGGAAQDRTGKWHYLGVYEREKDYDRFKTWGAKRYAFEQNGIVYVTTAGVVKNRGTETNIGGKELAKHGGLEAYEPGFTFRESGGVEAIYNDNIDEWRIIDGHKLHITDNVVLHDSTYTLGITGEYEWLLNHFELLYDMWLNYQREHFLLTENPQA